MAHYRTLKSLVVEVIPPEHAEERLSRVGSKVYCRSPWGLLKVTDGDSLVKFPSGFVVPLSSEYIDRMCNPIE